MLFQVKSREIFIVEFFYPKVTVSFLGKKLYLAYLQSLFPKRHNTLINDKESYVIWAVAKLGGIYFILGLNLQVPSFWRLSILTETLLPRF